MDFGGGVISKESIGGNKVQRIKTFHWLSYGNVLLAELLLPKKESFLPPAEAVK